MMQGMAMNQMTDRQDAIVWLLVDVAMIATIVVLFG